MASEGDGCLIPVSESETLSMHDNLVIAAVFATMNRAGTAASCVSALGNQTRAPNLVVVADNVSTDDTIGVLESRDCLPFELVIHRMGENRGNAGGVEEAMDLAFEKGADAVWILDDDSWPRRTALELLLGQQWDPNVVRHPLQVDPSTGRFTWPLWVGSGSGWKLAFDECELPDSSLIRSKSSWTGALLSKEIREKVGPVNGELFIRGEDEEYPWRIAREGFSFEVVRGAVLDHPGTDQIIHFSFFGKHFFFERDLADWKLYYKVRNMVWLKSRKSGIVGAIMVAAAYALTAVCVDGLKRLPVVLGAIRDGSLGRLGKWKRH